MTLLSIPVPFASHLARSCRGWGHRGELLASFGGRLGSEGSGRRAAQGTVQGRCPLAGESARGPLPSFLLGFCSSRVMDTGGCELRGTSEIPQLRPMAQASWSLSGLSWGGGCMGKGWGGDGGGEAFPGADNHLSAVIAPPKTILDDHTLTLFQVLPACLPACLAGGCC